MTVGRVSYQYSRITFEPPVQLVGSSYRPCYFLSDEFVSDAVLVWHVLGCVNLLFFISIILVFTSLRPFLPPFLALRSKPYKKH